MFFNEKKCPICGVSYGLDPLFDDHRKNGATNDNGRPLGWHCPNGHPLIYKESEADRLRRERDRLQQQIASKNDELKELEARRRAAVGQVTKMRNRVSNGVCPCCNRTFNNVARHMASKHPEMKAEAAEAPTIQ